MLKIINFIKNLFRKTRIHEVGSVADHKFVMKTNLRRLPDFELMKIAQRVVEVCSDPSFVAHYPAYPGSLVQLQQALAEFEVAKSLCDDKANRTVSLMSALHIKREQLKNTMHQLAHYLRQLTDAEGVLRHLQPLRKSIGPIRKMPMLKPPLPPKKPRKVTILRLRKRKAGRLVLKKWGIK